MDEVYALVAEGDKSGALDATLDLFDDLLLAGKLKEVDLLLGSVDLEQLNVVSMLAILSATRSARYVLKKRSYIYLKIRDYLVLHHEDRAERLIHGLC